MRAGAKTFFFTLVTLGLGAGLIHYFGLDEPAYVVWFGFSLGVMVLASRRGGTYGMFYRCVLPLVTGFALIALYIEAHEAPLVRDTVLAAPINEFYGEQYFSVISMLYALITALILVKGIEGFERLSSVIDDETDQIRSIFNFLGYFEDESAKVDGAIVGNLKKLFLEYVHLVQKRPDISGVEENEAILRQCSKEVSRLKCADSDDRVALGELIRAVDNLSTIRTRRINCVRSKIPSYLIGALVVMSVFMVYPFMLEPPFPVSQNYMMIFVIGSFCTFLLFMLWDINDPFHGFWRVNLGAFKKLESWIKENV